MERKQAVLVMNVLEDGKVEYGLYTGGIPKYEVLNYIKRLIDESEKSNHLFKENGIIDYALHLIED